MLRADRIEALAVVRGASQDPSAAGRDAARHAALGALGLPVDDDHLASVRVEGGRGTRPELHLSGEPAAALGERSAHVSISHEGDTAAALVVIA